MGDFGGILVGSWRTLGGLSCRWEVLRGILEISWGGLGGILGHFGWILVYLGVIFGGSWGDLGGILGHFGGILGVSWGS